MTVDRIPPHPARRRGRQPDEIHDIVGIGYGPSNLALAIALSESEAGRSVRARFVERQETFGWHRGMLLPRTTMQVSFLKDLATQRNARSEYSFVNYLTERGRLNEFINHQTFFPTRHEFHDYLEWAAARVDADVSYGTSVVDVDVVDDHFVVTVEGRDAGVLRTRNLVVANGLQARLPNDVQPSRRVFHNHQLLSRLRELPEPTRGRWAVIGAGQSAAEVVEYLHTTYPDAEVHAIFGKYGYSPSDDSPYANRIFDPAAVDDFHGAGPEVRARLMSYHRATNYSAVDLPLIEELYAREYAERVSGRRRLFVRGASRALDIVERGDGVDLRVRHDTSGRVENLRCDAVVCATGFAQMEVGDALGGLADRIVRDPSGPRVGRDYRLELCGDLPGAIYLQGGTEHSHGISASLLSNTAVRAGEIARSLVAGIEQGGAGWEGDERAAARPPRIAAGA
ncbi:lysine N(6)-hydroxylase/L-ornithine N(5)-oxygenase family protein [Millisia brevis]|uniref:lysine N(6)-hydroxylase/L-ornithine N(5)-oxygenase family protein n=1 Tax=Millisia brevis TaxID=264148 RepID=UPI0009FEE28F|nr:SidA/IucD/PvdA family monooxygenase [Millisia brevis]